MPKIQLPELQALSEYLTGKVPSVGMFSTLKGLIENSPKPTATAQEWAGYLKPGQIATRAGVEFPLNRKNWTTPGFLIFLVRTSLMKGQPRCDPGALYGACAEL